MPCTISADKQLNEIIYSGGRSHNAPKMMDFFCSGLTQEIATIRISPVYRIHTRLTVVIPSRHSNELIDRRLVPD